MNHRDGDSSLTYRKPFGKNPRVGLTKTRIEHKMGKGCLYIRKMSDVDQRVLERLIAGSVGEKRQRNG